MSSAGILYVQNTTNTNITKRISSAPLTAYNLDYAVKAAMCDGKGAAWTSAEQKAARERMGIDKEYELIEKIVIQEAVSVISRDVSLETLYIEMVTPATGEITGNTQYVTISIDDAPYSLSIGTTVVAGQARYAKMFVERKHGRYITKIYRAGSLNESLTLYSQQNAIGIIGNKITKIHFYNTLLITGTEISIYGVRA